MHFPSIPKIVFQTSKLKPEAYVLDQIKLFSGPQWSYFHFDDNAILDFFNKNPIPDFPDVISKFNSFKKGAHKADLFRYYYIYLNGGIFIDSDAIPRYQLDSVIKDCDFFP